MANKLPAMQFYPGDWRKDPGVQALDFETRGIWFEILMLMWESSERGKLTLNGQPIPDSALAQLLGIDVAKVQQTLSKLLSYGVASRDEVSGAIINRRMLRDEELRTQRAKDGRRGGLKKASNARSKRLANPASSSSSSSSSSKKEKKEKKKTSEPKPVEVPPDLQDLPLYASDPRLCAAWTTFRPAQEKACPGIDILSETRKAHAWEDANPSRRKRQRTRFLSSWFARAQDHPRNGAVATPIKDAIDAWVKSGTEKGGVR